jgi:hypothetical protein
MSLSDQDHEKFNLFMFYIDDSVEAVIELGRKYNLEISIDMTSLEDFERLMELENVDPADNSKINTFAQFLGENFRRRYGGRWKLGDDEKDAKRYAVPVIAGHAGSDVSFDPIDKTRKFARQRKSGLIQRAILSIVKPEVLDVKPEHI